jgi:hypothetical protein
MSDTDVLLGGFGLFGGRGEYYGRIKVRNYKHANHYTTPTKDQPNLQGKHANHYFGWSGVMVSIRSSEIMK